MVFTFEWLAFLIAFIFALLYAVRNFVKGTREGESILLFVLVNIVISLVLSLALAFIGGLIFPDSAVAFTIEIFMSYFWSVIIGAIIPPIGEYLVTIKLGD